MSSPPLPYTIVISTFERPVELAAALDSVILQTRQPASLIIVDSSRNDATREVCDRFADRLPMHYLPAEKPSAAIQRNQGGRLVETPLVAFMDDDVVLQADNFTKFCTVFENDPDGKIGGVAGRISDMQHSRPGRLLHAYYRLQAGYDHPDYGARLFGPGINCLPTYDGDESLIRSDWLNSTCVVYRTSVFQAEEFPVFEGYSFLEDVHLSARVAKQHALYFLRDAVYDHNSASSEFKRNYTELARRRLANQRDLTRNVLGLSGLGFECKFFLHRLFISISILRGGGPGRWQELRGTWI